MAKLSINFHVESSVLFKYISGKLYQRIDLTISNSQVNELIFLLKGYNINYKEKISLGKGSAFHHIFLPEIKKPEKCIATLQSGDNQVSKEVILLPRKKWEVHLIHFSHTDTGYTDLPSRIARNHGRFLRDVLNYCSETDDYPIDAKFRWTIETGYQFLNGWERLSSEEQKEIIDRIKEERIELTPIYLAHTSELYDYEILARTTVLITEFCRLNNIPLKSAMNTDITGLPWALVQILNKSGIRYLSTAVNATRGRAPNVPRPFYWETEDGSRVLVWNADPKNSYIEGSTLGFTNSYDTVLDKLPRYLKRFEGDNFLYDIVGLRTAGANADNASPAREISDTVRKWSEKWAYPHVIFSTNGKFMEALEKRGSENFPVYRKAWPDYWIDTFGAVSREVGVCRVTHDDISLGEKISTIISLYDKRFRYPNEEINETYKNVTLADEADWCAAEGVEDPDSLQSKGQFYEQAAFAYRAAITAKEVQYFGKEKLLSLIKLKGENIIVFNALSWKRTDAAYVKIPKNYLRTKYPVIYDSNGNAVPTQRVKETPREVEFAFLAKDVPPLGYRIFSVELSDKPAEYQQGSKSNSQVLENSFYKIRFNRDGTIGNIFDKEAKREIINKNNKYGFNQLIYEETIGGRPPLNLDLEECEQIWKSVDLDFMENAHKVFPARFPDRDTKFNRTYPTYVEHQGAINGQVYSSISNRTSLNNISRAEREVILYNDLKRIDFILNLDKRETRNAEAVYVAFPFAMNDFKIEIENAYSFLTPEKGQLPDTCRDWYLVQKWIRLFNNNFSVFWSPIEAPLVQLGEIQTGKWLHNLDLKESTIYSWLFNNYWWTNIPASQGGWNYRFRYSISSSEGAPTRLDAFRCGWNHHSPLKAWFSNSEFPDAIFPEDSYSLCEINAPNVITTALKKAEDGDGIILRLFEIEGKTTDTTLLWKGPSIQRVFLTNPVEKNISSMNSEKDKISLTLEPYSITTLRITT